MCSFIVSKLTERSVEPQLPIDQPVSFGVSSLREEADVAVSLCMWGCINLKTKCITMAPRERHFYNASSRIAAIHMSVYKAREAELLCVIHCAWLCCTCLSHLFFCLSVRGVITGGRQVHKLAEEELSLQRPGIVFVNVN